MLGPASDLAPPVGRSIGQDPAYVTLGFIGPADSRPVPEGTLKRELEKVFGLCPVLPDKQQRCPQQAARARARTKSSKETSASLLRILN